MRERGRQHLFQLQHFELAEIFRVLRRYAKRRHSKPYSSVVTVLSPYSAYQQALTSGFKDDPAQHEAALCLQRCFEQLQAGEPDAQGVYLWGPVGRGKTWLMDRFHQALTVPARRQHFHHFMRWVHRRLFQLTGQEHPLSLLAQELAAEARVLCLDELYEGGFNRERLLPAIAAIKQHVQVVSVDGGQDHRLHPGERQQRYWVNDPQALEAAFTKLLSDGEQANSEPLLLGHREINVVQRSQKALWCRYDDLCEQKLAAQDFIELCDRFSQVFLSEVPRLTGGGQQADIARGTEDGVTQVAAGDRQLQALSHQDDGVRRFIALVDECYDRGIPLHIDATVPLSELYSKGALAFPFRRTLSRLQEMQMHRFGQ